MDLRVMSPTSYQTALPRVAVFTITVHDRHCKGFFKVFFKPQLIRGTNEGMPTGDAGLFKANSQKGRGCHLGIVGFQLRPYS